MPTQLVFRCPRPFLMSVSVFLEDSSLSSAMKSHNTSALANHTVKSASSRNTHSGNHSSNYGASGYVSRGKASKRRGADSTPREPSSLLGRASSPRRQEIRSRQGLAHTGYLLPLKYWHPRGACNLFSNSFVITDSPSPCWQKKVRNVSGGPSPKNSINNSILLTL